MSTTLTFLPGDTSQVVPVSITNDDTNEEQEMFTATLSNPLGASLGPDTTATISIDDDDRKSLRNGTMICHLYSGYFAARAWIS